MDYLRHLWHNDRAWLPMWIFGLLCAAVTIGCACANVALIAIHAKGL